METIATGLQELSLDNEELPLSVNTVMSNDDLLIEILLKLPLISLVLFKSVSKRWLSLIKDDTFVKRRSLIRNIDPPSGLFFHFRYSKVLTRVSVPFDIRIPLQDEKIFKTVPSSSGNIYPNTTVLQSCSGLFLCSVMQSCNGLFLCSVMPGHRFGVYNPTVNLFKVLPEPHYYDSELFNFTSMAFDPTKSPHYKVVHATRIDQYFRADQCYRFRIQTYSSEKSIWIIVCSCSNLLPTYFYFRDGIYCNDAIYWINFSKHYKLDFVNNSAVLTEIQEPVDSKFCKLFESRGCLLLLGMDRTDSDQLNIYEIGNGYTEWTFKYSVNHWRISSYVVSHRIDRVLCIALGESEEDSIIVIVVDGKVVLYKFVLKTFHEFPQLISPEITYYYNKRSFLFTASFASV